jgi:hypothetical protein
MALVGGAACAVATDAAARRLSPSQRVTAASAGLVTAAIIYPAARIGRPADRAVAHREWLVVGATIAVSATASRDSRTSRAARAAVAAGWVGHAAFDNLHDRGPTSRLPDWYPAVCAGYDVALAALLLRNS